MRDGHATLRGTAPGKYTSYHGRQLTGTSAFNCVPISSLCSTEYATALSSASARSMLSAWEVLIVVLFAAPLRPATASRYGWQCQILSNMYILSLRSPIAITARCLSYERGNEGGPCLRECCCAKKALVQAAH